MKSTIAIFVIATIAALACAKCTQTRVDVSNSTQLQLALDQAKPGTTIVLKHNQTYQSYSALGYLMTAKGEEGCPITITTDEYGLSSGYAKMSGKFNITGSSYIVFKDMSIQGHIISYLCDHMTFENLNISDFQFPVSAYFAADFDTCTYVTMHKCVFASQNMCDAILFTAVKHATISECAFLHNGDFSIVAHTAITSSFNVTVTGCAFAGEKASIKQWVTLSSNKGGILIKDNFFTDSDCKDGCIWLSGENPGASSFVNNFFALNEGGLAFRDFNPSIMKVCASNRVFGGGMLTTRPLDYTC